MPEDNSFINCELPYSQEISALAETIATEFRTLPQVTAVALAGSQTTEVSDDSSD
ncbi:hypothetical protein [Komarekiella delphini-convector]|uniref:hypothetical protein n=1 Tax=Komarekiella delphini-convector TaxID=3050158 RepID=UPI001CD8B8B2|nr:hypothetical protein [Komarekiella delphini-convector]